MWHNNTKEKNIEALEGHLTSPLLISDFLLPTWMFEVRSDAGRSWTLEVGSQKLEVRSRKLEVGRKKQ